MSLSANTATQLLQLGLRNIIVRLFIAMLVAISMFAAQTANAYAQSGQSAKSALTPNFRAAMHATYSETGVNGRDTQAYDEALAIMIIVLNRTDSGAYGDKTDVTKVVYHPEYRGPINHSKPWAKKDHAGQFYKMADELRPFFEKWQRGEPYIPARLQKYAEGWHSDNAPRGDIWGDFLGQEGDTCFYKARKFRTGVKDACTAGKKNAEPKKRLDQQAANANEAVPAENNLQVASK